VNAFKSLIKGGEFKMNIAIVYILISVLGGAFGQLMLKKGMGSMGPLTLSVGQLGSILWGMATNPYVVAGLGIYALGTLFWLLALSRVELSFAYPFASLSYLIMLFAAWQLFKEDISVLRLVGTLVICVGVLIISRS
jgi:multidrug transporter EmrE-like cation transporter